MRQTAEVGGNTLDNATPTTSDQAETTEVVTGASNADTGQTSQASEFAAAQDSKASATEAGATEAASELQDTSGVDSAPMVSNATPIGPGNEATTESTSDSNATDAAAAETAANSQPAEDGFKVVMCEQCNNHGNLYTPDDVHPFASRLDLRTKLAPFVASGTISQDRADELVAGTINHTELPDMTDEEVEAECKARLAARTNPITWELLEDGKAIAITTNDGNEHYVQSQQQGRKVIKLLRQEQGDRHTLTTLFLDILSILPEQTEQEENENRILADFRVEQGYANGLDVRFAHGYVRGELIVQAFSHQALMSAFWEAIRTSVEDEYQVPVIELVREKVDKLDLPDELTDLDRLLRWRTEQMEEQADEVEEAKIRKIATAIVRTMHEDRSGPVPSSFGFIPTSPRRSGGSSESRGLGSTFRPPLRRRR